MKGQCDYYARRDYTGILFYDGEPDGLIKRVCETPVPEVNSSDNCIKQGDKVLQARDYQSHGNESSWKAAGGGQSLALGEPTIPSMSLYL